MDQLVNQRILGKYQYDFAEAGTEERVLFVGRLVSEMQERFGTVPFPDLLAARDPRAALQARRARCADADSDALLLDAVLSDLPKFLSCAGVLRTT